ncbi:P-loop containing nucleoside triphosphate hydrolase protein [Scheffersomyces amazonensis]|uniref:P-loop containing nucleoside triphosphate hydrolase protein n=1 Tax=Scheffersomyces amazonensis TaxID=1078765 RepID=UPI00315D5FFC
MSLKFVPRRIFPNYNIPLANFKGHHQKALTRFGHLAPQIDLVLEVRDSRAPISTINVLFRKILGNKEKIVIYSKNDLSVLKTDIIKKWHESLNEKVLFIDCNKRSDAKKVINLVTEKYNSMDFPPPLGLRLMIVGMPNVGKSSLVNNLRYVGYSSQQEGSISSKTRKVAKTGGQPGVTTSTSEVIKLSEDPNILVYDTPGVFLPTIKDSETMLALSLVGCVHDSFIDPVIQADYLLYLLNLQDPTGSKYSEYLDHPTNSIDELLFNIAKTRGVIRTDGTYDEDGMALHWVSLWKQGKHRKYRGLFDLAAILEYNEKDLQQIFKTEMNRTKEMKVHEKIMNSNSDSDDKHRKRTAKDREYDLRNRLFK